MITRAISLLSLFVVLNITNQGTKPISEVSLVKIKNNKREEALFFYMNNWKVFREAALKKGYIVSYKLFVSKQGSNADFDIMLITNYKDSIQFKNSEANFAPILKSTRPQGPKLMNDVKREDFIEHVSSSVTEVVTSER